MPNNNDAIIARPGLQKAEGRVSDVPAWWLYTVIFMQLGISLLIGMRCDTLSKRIDLVHRRISRNSRVNSLIDYWDDEDDGALPPANRGTA